jgi:CHAT domain-containing protein
MYGARSGDRNVNPRHLHRLAWLMAAPLPLHAAAAAPRGCDAAWLAPAAQQVRLLALDESAAAVAMGPLVFARTRLVQGAAVAGAQDSGEPATATLARESADGSRWRVRGTVVVDATCSIEVDAVAGVEPADAATRAAVLALERFGQARAAADAARLEQASEWSAQALRVLQPAAESAALAATITAFAVERLVDQRQLGRARELLGEVRPQVAPGLQQEQPAALRLELAAIRLLDWPDALPARERLQPQLVATFGERGLPVLENRVRLATNRMVLNRAQEALAEFDSLEALLRSDPRPLPGLRLLLARAHANTLALLGRQDAQLDRLQRLRIELAGRYGEDDRRVVDLDADVARGLADAERLAESLAGAARVYLWRDRVLGPDHARTHESAQLLALLYGRTGRYGTARALLEHLLRRIDPATDLDLTIRVRRDLATWLALDGAADAALGLMGQAHHAARERYSQDSIYAVGLAIDYGWLLTRAGHTGAACELLASVRERAPEANGLREWADAGLARCLLARNGSNADDETRALQLLRDAHATALRLAAPDNLRTLVWQAMLAGAELRTGARAQARRRLVDFVYRAERYRQALATGSAVRDSTFGMWIAEADTMAGYRTLALLHARDGELDEALRVSELARDRQLRDRFAERRWLDLPARVAESARLRELTAQRQRLDEAIAVAGVAARVRLEAQRVGVAQEADALYRDLARRFPQSVGGVTPSVAALQARLGADTTLVAYQRAGATWWITLIDARSVQVAEVADSAAVGIAARAWARAVRGEPVRLWQLADGRWSLGFVRPQPAAMRVPIAAAAQRLGAALLGPVAQRAPNARRLVIVADDELIGLPWDALPLDARGTSALLRYEITHAASFGGWIELHDRAARRTWPRDLFALAASADGPAGETRANEVAPAAGRDETWAPLPFARLEVESIARGFAAARVRTLFGEAAGRRELAAANGSGELARYRYVHFATHARVEPEWAERAALVLPAAGGRTDLLTATEFAGLAMGAELVVLSACDTGVGRFEPGQGLLGFAFAALAAGNRGALLSLWPVQDESTARLMVDLYARLRAGLRPAAALAAAKRALAASSDPRARDPRAWAAFQLYGSADY